MEELESTIGTISLDFAYDTMFSYSV